MFWGLKKAKKAKNGQSNTPIAKTNNPVETPEGRKSKQGKAVKAKSTIFAFPER